MAMKLVTFPGPAGAPPGWARLVAGGILAAAILSLAAPPIALAQPSTASSGDFSVSQITTDNPDRLVADWRKQTIGVILTGMTRTVRYKPLFTFIIFKGCTPDAAGACDVTADFSLTGAKPKPSVQQTGLPVWTGRAPKPGGYFQLSTKAFALTFDDGDALGPYTAEIAVTDHVAGVTLHTQQTLTLEPTGSP